MGLWCRSGVNVSVEKDFGSNPNGEADRMKPLAGNEGACWPFCSTPGLWVALCAEESGESEGAPPGKPSLDDPGDELSGFAIRRPPSDWARLRSPSIVRRCVDNDSEQPAGNLVQQNGHQVVSE